jgi:hypothetical protein
MEAWKNNPGRSEVSFLEYAEYLGRLRTSEPDLANRLDGVDCLEKLLAWLQQSGLGLSGLNVLAQDEYSHDFLIPLGEGGRWLVFGMT